MQKSALAILLTTTLALPLVGHAQESYVKLQVGKSDYRDVGESIRPAAFLLGVGMSLSKTWDVEAGYVRFGMVKTSDPTTTIRTQTQSLYVAGVGISRSPRVSLPMARPVFHLIGPHSMSRLPVSRSLIPRLNQPFCLAPACLISSPKSWLA